MRIKWMFIFLFVLVGQTFGQLVFRDASFLPVLGKATQQTETRYERLPDSLKTSVRPVIWSLGQNSAGLAIRFRSNSTTIAARWEVLNDKESSNMTNTCRKGLDLYCLEGEKWVSVNSGRPTGKKTEATIIANMLPKEREYMLYLSLYDHVSSLEIGVDSLASLDQPQVNLPIREKPVVAYGSSILQGGSASRPGMAHTNILSRWLNREFINLGFSGNAKLDYEIAEVIANVDASLYILDFLPNATVDDMNEKAERFYSIIRTRRPTTPIIFVEDPIFTNSPYDTKMAEEIRSKNATIHRLFDSWKARGDENISLLSSAEMIGDDGEATIDGIHFTDLGFMRYATLLYKLF
jgi:hypothetical protein